MKTELINGKFEFHASFDNGGQRIDSYEIKCKGHIMNGKRIVHDVWTPKTSGIYGEFGTPEPIFYLGEHKKKTYKTINGLLKSLGLPILPK